jgi:hypothetical protein
MKLAPRLGQLHLPLALGQAGLFFCGALIHAMGAAHTLDVVR